MILLETNATVWIANLTSTVVLLSVIGYAAKRYVDGQDKKLQALEKKTDDCDDRSDKIEKNYKSEFIEVRKEINDSNNRLQTELTKEIRAVTKEKTQHDLEQAVSATEMKVDMKHLQKTFDQILRVLK